MSDNFEIQRNYLVEEIKAKGIKDERVLEAIRKVPRHLFMPKEIWDLAYEDAAQPIGEGQTISQPYTVAFMTELLEVKHGDKILEIGTGSGYQAAILAELGAQVYTVERIRKLYERTTELLKQLNYTNIKTFYADGYNGLPQYAPFDKIIITAAIPKIPQTLFEQLKIGGYLVAPVGEANSFFGQQMIRFIKHSPDNIQEQYFGAFVFVPMKKGLQ